MKSIKLSQKGFTILELLIATSVFSVVLLLIMSALLQISRTYYKGIITTRTQEVARGVMTDISERIQFSGGEVTPEIGPTGNSTGFCVGNFRYSTLPLVQYRAGRHGLMVDNNGNSPCADVDAQNLETLDPTTLDPSSREFLQPGMRVLDLTVVDALNNLYRISFTIAYGDDDLFVDRDNNGVFNNLDAPYACASAQGSQFCAITSLTTTVQKRVQ